MKRKYLRTKNLVILLGNGFVNKALVREFEFPPVCLYIELLHILGCSLVFGVLFS